MKRESQKPKDQQDYRNSPKHTYDCTFRTANVVKLDVIDQDRFMARVAQGIAQFPCASAIISSYMQSHFPLSAALRLRHLSRRPTFHADD
jgi:hypothetical protein